MAEENEANTIRTWRKQWVARGILSELIITAGSAVLFSVFIYKLSGISLWTLPVVFILFSLLVLFLRRTWKIKEESIAGLLNHDYPELQESSGLLLKDYSSLNILEKIQYRQTKEILVWYIRTDAYR